MKKEKKWVTQFHHNGKSIYIGRYKNEIDAAIAVNKKCIEIGIEPKNSSLPNDSENLKKIEVSQILLDLDFEVYI